MAFTYNNYNESDSLKKKKSLLDSYSTYNPSQAVLQAKLALASHEANKVADWDGGNYGQAVTDALSKITNREDFSYSLNGDALYQQYKNQYINQGRLAMQDTMGQAAAMTGGYGNSYAATVGNQQYQAYLQKLNDVVPELYQLALDKYNQEGQDLLNQYSVLSNQYDTEYGQYRDKVTDWNNTYDRLSNAYYNEANMDYSRFADNRDYYANQYYNDRDYEYGLYSDAYNRAFSNYQQGVSEDQFAKNLALDQAQLAETIRANKASEALSYARLAAEKEQEKAQTVYSDAEYYKMAKENGAGNMKKASVTQSNYSKVLSDISKMSKADAKEYVKQQWANGNLTTSEYTTLYNKIRG